MRPEERTALEMERGRIIGERRRRESDLHRLIEGKKVTVNVCLPGHVNYEPQGQVNIYYVEGVAVGHQNIIDDDFPREALMATIQLAVSATVGYDGVPSAETIDPAIRAQRDLYRDRHVGQWREHYGK